MNCKDSRDNSGLRIRVTTHRDFALSLPSFSSHALRYESQDTIFNTIQDFLNPGHYVAGDHLE